MPASTATSSELTITPCSASSGWMKAWTVLAPRWSTSAPSSSSARASATTSGSSSTGSWVRGSSASRSSLRREVVQKPERRQLGSGSRS